MSERARMVAFGLAVVAGFGGLLWLRDVPPENHGWLTECWLHSTFGWHCPGCGTTRAAHSLLHGDPAQAAAWNGVGLLAVILVVTSTYASFWRWVRQQPLPPVRRRRWLLVTLVFAFVMFTVVRNIPVEPFCSLAPHRLTTVR